MKTLKKSKTIHVIIRKKLVLTDNRFLDHLRSDKIKSLHHVTNHVTKLSINISARHFKVLIRSTLLTHAHEPHPLALVQALILRPAVCS